MNRFDLSGKTALVTGSTRGIGFAIAQALADAGAHLIAHGVSQIERSEQALAQLKQHDPKAELLYCDLSQTDAAEQVTGQLRDRGASPDIIVFNAAVQVRKTYDQLSPDEIDFQIQTNFTTTFRLIQKLTPPLIERGWGRLVFVGSVQEARPSPAFPVYAAMKSAQVNLVENLAKQLGPHGITVNNLSPGVFATDRNSDALANDEYAQKILAIIPSGYAADPQDCAGPALLLCSEAGRYINGATLRVDGGMSLP